MNKINLLRWMIPGLVGLVCAVWLAQAQEVKNPADLPVPGASRYDIRNLVKLVSTPTQTVDRLILRNGDLVEGEMTGLDATSIEWNMPLVSDPVRFRWDGVDMMSLRTPPSRMPAPSRRWVVRLANGDQMQATTLAVNGDTVQLEANNVGTVRLARQSVSAIFQNTNPGQSKTLTHQNLEDWDQIKANTGPDIDQRVYRELDLPDPALIEFELTNQENREIHVRLPLDTTLISNAKVHAVFFCRGNAVMLRPSNSTALIYPDGLLKPLPTKPGGIWRIGVAISRKQGKAVLFVDGKQLDEIYLDELKTTKARGVAVIHKIELSEEPEIRSLTITQSTDLWPFVEQADKDQLRFQNGDAVAGRLESIDATNAVLISTVGRLEVPTKRLAEVLFATGPQPPVSYRADDVAVFLYDGSKFVGRLEDLGAAQVTLIHPVLGSVKLDRAAVRRIQFGLNLPPPQKRIYDPASLTDALRAFKRGQIGLINGQRLSGNLTSLTDTVVGWQHPAALQPIRLARANVAHVNPSDDSASTASPTPLPPVTVELTNGDSFQADVIAMDRKQLQVRTGNGTTWKIPSAYVRALYPNQAADVIEAGPPANGDITQPDLRPALQQLSYRQYNWTNALPDRVCVQWELVGPPVNWRMNATIFDPATGNNPDPRRDAWFLSLGNQTLSLFDNGAGPTYRGSSAVCLPEMTSSGRVCLTLLADRKAGEQFLLLNGQLVNERRNIKQPATGNTISAIVSIAQLRHIVVQEWKGAATELTPPAAGDAVRLHDWTVASGPIEGLRDGQVLLAGGKTIPIGQVAALHFDPATRQTVEAGSLPVTVTLNHGERLQVAEPKVDASDLVGMAPGIGSFRWPLTSVRRVDFVEPPPAKWKNLVASKTFAERTQYCYKCHR